MISMVFIIIDINWKSFTFFFQTPMFSKIKLSYRNPLSIFFVLAFAKIAYLT